MKISDYILTREEEQAYLAEEEVREDSGHNTSPTNEQETRAESSLALNTQEEANAASEGEDTPPAWEQIWGQNDGLHRDPSPEDTSGYFWELRLAEISQLPAPGYQPFDDLLKSPYYTNQM